MVAARNLRAAFPVSLHRFEARAIIARHKHIFLREWLNNCVSLANKQSPPPSSYIVLISCFQLSSLINYHNCQISPKIIMSMCGVFSIYDHDPELKSKYVADITAKYTGALHFLMFFYFFGVWEGVNETDWVPAPTFEYSIDTVYTIALVLAIYCIFYIIAASCGLARGVRTVSCKKIHLTSLTLYRST